MKTTLILNRKYEKLPSAKNILRDFCYVQICYCTFGCTSKSQKGTLNLAGAVTKLSGRVYSRNSEASVSNDKIPAKMARYRVFVFVFVSFLFLKSANILQVFFNGMSKGRVDVVHNRANRAIKLRV